MANISQCAGDSLPDNWWRDKDLFERECAAHGSNAEIARAHSLGETAVRKWRTKHGLPAYERSAAAGPLPLVAKRIPSADEDVDEAEKLRERLKIAHRELEKYRRRQVEVELIADRFLDHVKAATPKYKPPKPANRRERVAAQDAVLLEGDFHASEVVNPEEVWGMNEYNWDVMIDRMAVVQESTLSHVAHAGFRVPRLVLGWLGDMASGDIHEELAVTNDRPAAAAIVDLAYELAAHVEPFVPEFERIDIVAVPGNHPRLSKKPTAKMAYNNGDWLIYKMVESILSRYETVHVHAPRSGFARVTVADRWKLGLLHGDGIRSTMPGVPWGGISRRVASLMEQANAAQVAIDYLACGHFHTANALDGVVVETFMNGSLKGVDEYSLKQFGGGRAAKQRLLFFHRDHGVTGMHWIGLQPQTPMSERRAA